MATGRFPGIDNLVEETIRSTGALTVQELVARLADRAITKGQVRNAVYRLKIRGKIGARKDGSADRYETR